MVCKILSCLCGEVYIPQRWLGALLTQSVICICFCMRVCTSVALSRMVKKRVRNKTSTSKGSGCPVKRERWNIQVQYGENDWSEIVQSWISNSFFIGYVLMHVPAGYLSDKYGSRWVLISGVLVSVVCTALTPISADKVGYIAVIFLRITLGFGQGVIFPGNTSWLCRWIPIEERGFAGGLSSSGTSIGPLLGILVTNVILKLTGDWRDIYYFWSTMGSLLLFALVLYLYSDPTSHLHITQKELERLHDNLISQPKTWPYRKILSDYAVIAIIIGQAGHDFVIFLIGNNMPKYMNEVLKYNISDNSVVTSLPYITMIGSTILGGIFADWLINKRGWDIGFVRKLYTTIASVASSGLLVAVGYVGCNNKIAVTLFTLALCSKGLFFSGLKINPMDVSKRYGGAIMAFANGAGCFSGFFGPYIVSAFASDNQIPHWQIVFWIMFGISAASNIFYVVWGSGQRRRWDYPEEDRQFFEGKVKIWQIFDGEDKDRLAVERGRANLLRSKTNAD